MHHINSREICTRLLFPRAHLNRTLHPQRRQLWNIPKILLPPAIFTGLFIGLWTWKCLMLITFQRKIIFMPTMPPNARTEKIEDYKQLCAGIQWRTVSIRSLDGTKISLCVASVDNTTSPRFEPSKRVYIIYFQGNASSLPPRLPLISPILRILRDANPAHDVRYIMICLSYRGYWTSSGRPSEKGIALDAQATLNWIREEEHRQEQCSSPEEQVNVILWGQSIGSGVATTLAANQNLFAQKNINLRSLILETPFLNTKSMLQALYPQKWLPYQYLYPFLRTHLDSYTALETMCHRANDLDMKVPKVVIIEAGRDELVPGHHGTYLEKRCQELGIVVERRAVDRAFHQDVLIRNGGRSAIVDAVRKTAQIVTSENE